MNRTITLCALSWLAAAISCLAPGWQIRHVAVAQGVVAPAPGGQPMWVNQPPMYQVGPNGAVNLDRPMTMPYSAFQLPGEVSCETPTYPAAVPAPGYQAPAIQSPFATQVAPQVATQAAPQPPSTWVVPAQQVPAQPVPAAPLMPPAPIVVPAAPTPFTWMLFGEALYLHPTGADMAHAQQENGGVPFGLIGVADPSYDIGFRVGGELQFAPDAAIFGSFAHFEESSFSSLVAPAVGEIGSLVHHPFTGVTTSAGPVDATYDIEFQLGDLAYRQYLVYDCLRKVSVFAGGRYGNLEQRFFQSGVFAGVLPGRIDTSTNIEFTGGGPMVGIDAERMIGLSRFSVYGHALVAALAGQFDSQYRMVNSTTDTLLAEAIWQDDRIVPMLDYELGLAWTSAQGHFRFSAGYLASHWFNAVTTPVFIDAVQADNYVDVDDTISFDGLVGRAEVRW